MEPVVHVIAIAVTPKTADDAMKLRAALPLLADEDPTLAYDTHADVGQFLLQGTSETHLEIAIDRLIRVFNVQLSVGQPEIAYRETITRTVEYDYTHKKQTGGAGQFARVKIRFEPLPRGSGFEFENEIIGGSVPQEFVPGVEKGLKSASDTGVFAGYPTIDFKASLIDGAYHDVDSNVMTFEAAARAAFRDGMANAVPLLLEPIMKAEVTTPEEYAGEVIGDLNRRRASISGMDSRPDAWVIHATVPFKELLGYGSRLRGMTRGRGQCTMQFDHYAPLPGDGDLDPVHPGAAIGLRIA